MNAAAPAAPPGEEQERELLTRLRAGEDAAFDTLVRAYSGRMLATARRLLRNEADACDALQDAFISAFRGIAAFAGESRLSTWLHRIIVDAALMKLRTARRRQDRSIDDLLPAFLNDGHAREPADPWAEPPAAAAERAELRAFVRQCIDELPENHRTVLLLRDIEGLDTRAAAELLQLDPGTLKVRLHRARQALRTLLDERMRRPRP